MGVFSGVCSRNVQYAYLHLYDGSTTPWVYDKNQINQPFQDEQPVFLVKDELWNYWDNLFLEKWHVFMNLCFQCYPFIK
jgi:hypothetical protein